MTTLTEITRACEHTVKVVLSTDPQRAMTEIEQLVSGNCGACVKAARRADGYVASGRMFWPGVR